MCPKFLEDCTVTLLLVLAETNNREKKKKVGGGKSYRLCSQNTPCSQTQWERMDATPQIYTPLRFNQYHRATAPNNKGDPEK